MRFDVTAEHPANSLAAMAEEKVEIVQSSGKVLHSEIVALREQQDKDYLELQVAIEVARIAVAAPTTI